MVLERNLIRNGAVGREKGKWD